MPLEAPDQLHLRAAVGYIELEMFDEANAQLEEIDPLCRHLPEVLAPRLAIYHGLQKWDLLAVVAKRLAEWNPKEPGFFIECAYATRRAESIHAAHAILTRAADLHPNNGTIHFNLACYEAQMGGLDRAKAHLKRATEIDAKFRLMALEDPDLEPLWASMSAERKLSDTARARPPIERYRLLGQTRQHFCAQTATSHRVAAICSASEGKILLDKQKAN